MGGTAALGFSIVAANNPASAQASCTDGQNRWLLVENLKPTGLYWIQWRAAYSSAAWSEDMLGSTVTPSGSSVFVLMPSDNCQCRADVKITMESGTNRELTYTNINYCSRSDGQRARLVVD
jgi:hypothetical protein